MIPTEKELGNFETTHNNIMKRLLDTPPTITSQELINLETNIPTATDMINERQIIYMLKSNRKEGITKTPQENQTHGTQEYRKS